MMQDAWGKITAPFSLVAEDYYN